MCAPVSWPGGTRLRFPDERGSRRRTSADRRGRRTDLAGRRQRRRRRRRRGVRLLGHREPAHRPGRGRLHARLPRERPLDARLRLLRRDPRARRRQRDRLEMHHVDVDFSGGSTQSFHIGTASCACPGHRSASRHAHRSFGRCRGVTCSAPAIELARDGVELNDGQAYLHRILDLILRHTPESRAVYEVDGERRSWGDTLVQHDLAGTLEMLAEKGAAELYTGELGAEIVGLPVYPRRLPHGARTSAITASSGVVPSARASAARSTSPIRRRPRRRPHRATGCRCSRIRAGQARDGRGDRRARAA